MRLHLAFASVAVLSACATAPAARRPATPSEQLHAAVEQWFEEELALNPLGATYLGDHRYDDRFGNPASLEHERASARSCEDGLARVRAVDPAGLSAAEQLTRETFLYDCTQRLLSLRHPGRLLPLNQMDGPVLSLAMLGSGEGPQPFKTAADHETWLRRAGGFPAWVDSAISALREGQAVGITQPRVILERVVTQLDGLLAPRLEDSLFLRPLQKLPQGPDRARLEAAYRETFGQQVLPSLRRLRDFVRDEHLPRARTSVGLGALPGGAGWYAARAAASTTTDLAPEAIHALGKEEVQRIRSEMEKVMAQVGFRGDLQAFFTHVRTDPKYFFDRPEDLLEAHRALKRRLDAELPRLFSRFPRADYEVRAVEAFRAASAAGGEYQAPASDGSRPGIFYVNTHDLKAQPRYGLETLSLHEAAPGHHFQIALQQELESLPRFRRFGGYTAYSEGWALYAESLGRELGVFQDPMSYYGRLNDEQLRAMRLVVDTGLHAFGWSREQAIRFMLDNSSLAESDATAEVERYMVWPGQALGYKVGQLRMTALRARLQERLGAKFDVKAFHAAMLEDGQLPLSVLERKLDAWARAASAR
jgi:uncharacterized protein (DUF885 family)